MTVYEPHKIGLSRPNAAYWPHQTDSIRLMTTVQNELNAC